MVEVKINYMKITLLLVKNKFWPNNKLLCQMVHKNWK